MKATYPASIPVIVLLFLLFMNNGYAQDLTSFERSLTESRIGNTDYYISLPAGYVIKESTEYGFKTVYIFQPPDSTKDPMFTGGIYIGDHPKTTPPPEDSCTVLRKDKEILHRHAIWIIYKCREMILMQSVFSDEGKSGPIQINPFATVNNANEMEKVYSIYSTLIKK